MFLEEVVLELEDLLVDGGVLGLEFLVSAGEGMVEGLEGVVLLFLGFDLIGEG